MTGLALFFDLTYPEPGARARALTHTMVDGVAWKRVTLGDGAFAFQGFCAKCKGRLMTKFLRVCPTAVQCACGRWCKLP